jgi:hypothetical protein
MVSSSRQNFLKTINHQQPDRVVVDFGSTSVTGIHVLVVEKLGRKALMLVGSGGLAGIFAVIGAMYFFHIQGLPLLIMVVVAIACYAMSLAPVTWVLLSEIFQTGYGA